MDREDRWVRNILRQNTKLTELEAILDTLQLSDEEELLYSLTVEKNSMQIKLNRKTPSISRIQLLGQKSVFYKLCGMVQARRMPRGFATKMYVEAGDIDRNDKHVTQAGWYDKWYCGLLSIAFRHPYLNRCSTMASKPKHYHELLADARERYEIALTKKLKDEIAKYEDKKRIVK